MATATTPQSDAITSILNALHLSDPGTAKSEIAAGLTVVVGLVTPLLAAHGIAVPSDAMLGALAGVVAVLIAGNAAKSIAKAVVAGKTAAATVTTAAQGDQVISNEIAKQRAIDGEPTPVVNVPAVLP